MNEESKKQIYNEANIMKKLIHPNIISFKDVFKDTKLDYFYIVMEYADDGDLSKKIKQQQKKKIEKYFPEEKILKYFYQICKGINYIHSKNVIHRDIKSQNIFLMKNGNVKIGDFGIAKSLSKTKSNAMTIIGTPYYFSPEIINGEPYNYKTDIWSLGVVLYEMCNLKLPFDSNNIAQLSMKILRGNFEPIPFKYSKDMHNLVKKMLNVEQNKRPDIKEIMQYPLLQNINLNINNNNIKNKNTFNKKKKNWSNNNQKSVNINSTASNFKIKMNEPSLEKPKKERKSLVSRKVNKDKSVSPIKFKNKSFMSKAGFMKKNNENSDSSIELPKKSDKPKTKKSLVFKRNVSSKIISVKSKIKEEKINKIDNNINNIKNININNINKKSEDINNVVKINFNNNLNDIDNKSNNNILNNNNIHSVNKSNNIYNNFLNTKNNNNFSENNINNINDKTNKNIIINTDINMNDKNSNMNLNKNLFYDKNLINKDEIIIRSNAFDANFSGKSILFDKEKTINLLKEDNNNNNHDIINPFNENENENNDINKNSIHFNNIYNFNEQTIKMFTLKEEDEEKEKDTIKSNSNLYNGDIDNLNFIIQKNTTLSNNNKTQSDCVNYITKEENDENVIKVDLDFEIINNSMNMDNNDNDNDNRDIKDKNNLENKKDKKFDLEEYIKNKIGEKIYLVIKEYLVEMNIEQIINYSFDKMINKLSDILKKKKFREREIKNAQKYIFDIFLIIVNKNNN